MRKRSVLLVTGLVLSGALLPSANPAQSRERITITGCAFAGVTGRCLMIRAGDGTIYNITSASPRPQPGRRMIRLRGVLTDKVSVCGQGVVLERIRWTRTRQLCAR